jgi:hypothetical protein
MTGKELSKTRNLNLGVVSKRSRYGEESLDQIQLNPKLEVRRLTCLARESNPGLRSSGEHSSEELLEQCVN